MSFGDLFADEIPDFGRAVVGDSAGDDGGAAGGEFVEDAEIEIAVESQGEGAGDGSCGHDQNVGLGESCGGLGAWLGWTAGRGCPHMSICGRTSIFSAFA